MEAIWTALIVGTISPCILALLMSWIRHREKIEDYARQDHVAEKAAEAARLLVENNKIVAASALDTKNQLKVIHGLVNSNMTAAMQAEYEATEGKLVVMREIIELKRASGIEPSIESLAKLKATENKISELQAALDDRLKASQGGG